MTRNTGIARSASDVAIPGRLRLIESREAEDKTRLRALRDAARMGVDDIEPGRFRSFHSPQALARHLGSVADKAIAANKSAK
jgi:antitoxin ParD1/3/4